MNQQQQGKTISEDCMSVKNGQYVSHSTIFLVFFFPDCSPTASVYIQVPPTTFSCATYHPPLPVTSKPPPLI